MNHINLISMKKLSFLSFKDCFLSIVSQDKYSVNNKDSTVHTERIPVISKRERILLPTKCLTSQQNHQQLPLSLISFS